MCRASLAGLPATSLRRLAGQSDARYLELAGRVVTIRQLSSGGTLIGRLPMGEETDESCRDYHGRPTWPVIGCRVSKATTHFEP